MPIPVDETGQEKFWEGEPQAVFEKWQDLVGPKLTHEHDLRRHTFQPSELYPEVLFQEGLSETKNINL